MLTRRHLLGAIPAVTFWSRRAWADEAGIRALGLHNPHTDETFVGPYFVDGHYDVAALADLDWFMRDWRETEAVVMDWNLHDVLWRLRTRLRESQGFWPTLHVLSAYRTPQTNEMLRAEGAAQNSLHLYGQAADITVDGMTLSALTAEVENVGAGGIGIYQRSHFVHLDTGPSRRWTQNPRLRLDFNF